VSASRRRDSRLMLVVHGVGRAVVLRGTQALPYARADVAVLPDAEQLRTAAASVERCWTDPMRERNAELLARLPGAVLAAAAAEDRCWRAFTPPSPSPNPNPNHEPPPTPPLHPIPDPSPSP